MAKNEGTLVVAQVKPYDSGDTYPTHEATFGKGGLRAVADNATRDAIPTQRREQGMVVYVIATGLNWRLGADLVTWSPAPSIAASQPASVAVTVAGVVADLNTLIASLKAAGVMVSP
jgi:hypothetical protein